MTGDAIVLVEQLDGLVGNAGLDYLAHQPIRHRVEVAVDLDVVVQPRAAAPPFRVGIRLGRQVQQGITFDRLEQSAPGRAEMAHRPLVQIGDQLADRAVQLRQGEEPAVPQSGQHPALHHLDGDLDLGLVAGFAHAGG
jgi:hypothetical protein